MEKRPVRHVFVCRRHRDPAQGKPSCEAGGAASVYDAFKAELETRDLEETIRRSSCEVVVIATPTDLRRRIRIDAPVVRVLYDFDVDLSFLVSEPIR